DGGVRVTGVSGIAGVLRCDGRQDRVLPMRSVRVGCGRLVQLLRGKGAGEAWEVEEVRCDRGSLVAGAEVDEELLGGVLVLRQRPDRVDAGRLGEPEPAVEAGRDRPKPEVVHE